MPIANVDRLHIRLDLHGMLQLLDTLLKLQFGVLRSKLTNLVTTALLLAHETWVTNTVQDGLGF